MRQKTVITKLLQNVTEVYHEMRQVLKSEPSIAKCGKVWQLLQSDVTKYGNCPSWKINVQS